MSERGTSIRTDEPEAASHPTNLTHEQRHYPVSDDLASTMIPGFLERRRKTNNKSGWNVTPSRPPAGRLAQFAPRPSRGSGKTVHLNEAEDNAANSVALGEETTRHHDHKAD